MNVTTTPPNADQLDYLEFAGFRQADGSVELTNPEGVAELQRAIDEGQAKLVGSCVTGVECHDFVTSVVQDQPGSFEGNIISGERTILSSKARLMGCVVTDAAITTPLKIRNGDITGGFSDRRTEIIKPDILFANDAAQVVINPNQQTVTLNGQVVALTDKEYALFKALIENAGSIVQRGVLRKIMNLHGDKHCVDVHAANLRKKLEKIVPERLIKTKRGAGFFVSL